MQIKNKANKIDISFIIPAYNEAKYLPIVLQSIHNQKTSLVGEIILIDDSSTDGTVNVARRFQCRIYTNSNKNDVTRMRNDGLKRAKGTCVLFVDADCAFSPNYIAAMAEPIIAEKCEVSLCMRHYPLETSFSILPDRHASCYKWMLQKIPKFYWLKIPIRLFPWLAAWLKKIRKEKKITSPLSIPDRVHTSAIITKTDIARVSGGWKSAFGHHDDTQYCLDVFAHTHKVRWHWAPSLYISKRREFPVTNRAFLVKMLCLSLKKIGLDIRSEKEKRTKGGYVEPGGAR